MIDIMANTIIDIIMSSQCLIGGLILMALCMIGLAWCFHTAPCGTEIEGLGWFEVCRKCGEILVDGRCPECDE